MPLFDCVLMIDVVCAAFSSSSHVRRLIAVLLDFIRIFSKFCAPRRAREEIAFFVHAVGDRNTVVSRLRKTDGDLLAGVLLMGRRNLKKLGKKNRKRGKRNGKRRGKSRKRRRRICIQSLLFLCTKTIRPLTIYFRFIAVKLSNQVTMILAGPFSEQSDNRRMIPSRRNCAR